MNDQTRIVISMDRQTLDLFFGQRLFRSYIISTAEKGMGFTAGSFRTPTGKFIISEKIGENLPIATKFNARVPIGTWHGEPTTADLILSRILTLHGTEPENTNTLARYIYIHGTNREDQLGTPASHGCIRLSNQEMIELFGLVAVGTQVEISPMTHSNTKLLFIDCDSTLSSIEGIDELARLSTPEVFAEVVALTNAAMDGHVPLNEVFRRRMEIIKPSREMAQKVAELYQSTILPGAMELVSTAAHHGWLPVILSGGFAPLIKPLANALGIRHVEAVPLHFQSSGEYLGYGEDYPTTRNLGKNEIINDWKKAMLPSRVVMIGDGVSDLETKPDVDLMIGFGGVVQRPRVKEGADVWIEDFFNTNYIMDLLQK